MSISDYFAERLGAPLRNSRWSWGAINSTTGQLFLRVWSDEREPIHGKDCISIFNTNWSGKSLGSPERREHLALLKSGAEGFGILCVPRDSAKGRSIASFDDGSLLQFGNVESVGGHSYATILRSIPTAQISQRWEHSAALNTDLTAILATATSATSKALLVEARIGQGKFRTEVLRLWGNRCCVTGSTTLEAVRASHIKPWRHCDNIERLDPHNGLPLNATLDALFDVGLISFDSKGKLLVAEILTQVETHLLALHGRNLASAPGKKALRYLSFHRDKVFLSGPKLPGE